MSTGTVSPLPIAGGEAAIDKARAANRGGADERGEDGGFLKFVAKLSQEQGRGGRGEAKPTAGMGHGSRLNVGAWLRNGAEVPEEQVAAVDSDALGDQALPQQGDNLSLLLALAGVNDVAALAQLLAANAGSSQNIDPAAVAGRVANGTATQADIVLVHAALAAARNGEIPSVADPTMLANLAKANSQAEAGRAGKPIPEAMAKVVVLGRETHLAPVLAAAAVQGAPVAVDGNRVLSARSQPTPDTADAALAETADASADAQLVDPHRAVTELRDARWNANPSANGGPMGGQQPTADAAAMSIDAGPGDGAFPAASIARVDQIVNSAPAASVVQQIANGVVVEAGQLLGQAERPELRGLGPAQSFGSPVKVILIQLQPDGLGAVTIRMAVKDQVLQLALEVDRGETASLIQRERDTLSTLLRSAGYLIDGVDVRTTGPGNMGAPAMDGHGGMQMQGGGQSRGSLPDGRPQGTGAHDNPTGSGLGNRRNGDDEQAGNTRGRSGGLYV
jgi:flagellar hook-length control protein FliK